MLHSDRILELAYSASKTYTATAYFKVGKPAEKSGDPAPCFKFEYKEGSGKIECIYKALVPENSNAKGK